MALPVSFAEADVWVLAARRDAACGEVQVVACRDLAAGVGVEIVALGDGERVLASLRGARRPEGGAWCGPGRVLLVAAGAGYIVAPSAPGSAPVEEDGAESETQKLTGHRGGVGGESAPENTMS